MRGDSRPMCGKSFHRHGDLAGPAVGDRRVGGLRKGGGEAPLQSLVNGWIVAPSRDVSAATEHQCAIRHHAEIEHEVAAVGHHLPARHHTGRDVGPEGAGGDSTDDVAGITRRTRSPAAA